MMNKPSNLTVQCPTCHKPVTWQPESRFRPFCSARCKLIDLGEWANEKHSIAGEPSPAALENMSDEELEALLLNHER